MILIFKSRREKSRRRLVRRDARDPETDSRRVKNVPTLRDTFSDPTSDRLGDDRLTNTRLALTFKPIAPDYCRIDPNRNRTNQVSKSRLNYHEIPRRFTDFLFMMQFSYMPIVSFINCLTFEYIRLSGKLIAMLRTQTKLIFNMTRRLVLFRPNFMGYRRLRYRSTLMVHKCMMLAVHNNTSRQIQARQ